MNKYKCYWGQLRPTEEIDKGGGFVYLAEEVDAEIARLRKALDILFIAATNVLKIVRDTFHSDDRGPGDKCSLLEDAIEVAREALALEKEEGKYEDPMDGTRLCDKDGHRL